MSETITIDVIQNVGGKPFATLPEARIFDGGKKETAPRVTLGRYPDEVETGYAWAPWNSPWDRKDNFPTVIRRKINDSIAGTVVDRKAKKLFGNGLIYYRESDIRAGGSDIAPAYIQEVEDWLTDNEIETEWLYSQILDWCYSYNSFSELILSRDKTMITGMAHKEAEFSRLSLQNKTTGRIEELYYSPEFSTTFPTKRDNIARISLMPWWNKRGYLRGLPGYKFAWHTRIKTPGMIYYARPPWSGLFKKNGWLDVNADVPRIVQALQNNQVTLKYQIMIPMTYFQARYPDWDTYDAQQKERKINEVVTGINTEMTDMTTAYKTIVSFFNQDELTGKDFGKIEIIPVDDKLKRDAWVPGAEKSNAQITMEFGEHPSTLGLASEGGSMGAGSGSDKREIYNIEISTNTIEQKYLLRPLNFISQYNKWGVRFAIQNTPHTTTNDKESGLKDDTDPVQRQQNED